MKPDEIREMSHEEVMVRLRDIEEELSNLRFRLATRQLPDPLKVRHLRKEVARLKTVLREHELGIRRLATGGVPIRDREEISGSTQKDKDRKGSK
ncbi:MAG TPA: 50S ribosomal protein L29 [Candidatus Latescibacteria bacterium]|nr:50S ribosomal protein L29 [Candidatus Latescibacterota bacterium]